MFADFAITLIDFQHVGNHGHGLANAISVIIPIICKIIFSFQAQFSETNAVASHL